MKAQEKPFLPADFILTGFFTDSDCYTAKGDIMADNERSDGKVTDLVDYRKKRKRKKAVTKLIIVLAIFVLVFVAAANFSDIVEPLRGIASKIDTKTSDEIGFPIKLTGSASYSFDSFGDSFSLLTDTYLYTYGMNGGQNYAVRHSYSKPVQCTNSSRILLYDKDYNSFALYNKTRLVYSNTVEEKIVFASLGNKDSAAIVTNSDRYSNIIYIYNGNGEWRYTRKFIDENIMGVCFSSDERYIYAAAMGAENGEMYTTIYKYDITDESEAIWSYKHVGASIPLKMYVKKGNVCVLYDNRGVSLKESSGEPVGETGFSGTVLCCDDADSFMGVVYLDTSSNKKKLTAIDYDMNTLSVTAVTANINEVAADGGTVYIVQSGTLTGFNADMETVMEKPLSDDYTSFLKIGNSVLFLGYNKVDIENL